MLSALQRLQRYAIRMPITDRRRSLKVSNNIISINFFKCFLFYSGMPTHLVLKITLKNVAMEQVRLTVNSVHRLGLDRVVVEGNA